MFSQIVAKSAVLFNSVYTSVSLSVSGAPCDHVVWHVKYLQGACTVSNYSDKILKMKVTMWH